ncbi:MAG: hypothetical protein AMXMBFR81_29530 [Chthonomonas sp.]
MNLTVAILATLVGTQQARPTDLGRFDVVEYVRQERFAGRLHVHLCETLKVTRQGKTFRLSFECRRELRATRRFPPFHVGEPVSIFGVIKDDRIVAKREDAEPVLADHKHPKE